MSDVTLPFDGRSLSVREMTGVEEDLLADEKKVRDGRAVNWLLANCSGMDYNSVVALTTADRLAILLAIRMETYGGDLQATITCSNKSCHHKWNVSDFSLEKCDVYPRNRSDFGPNGEYQGKLSNGCGVTLRLLTGNDDRVFAAVSPDDRATFALMIPLMHINLPDGTVLQENDKKKWLKHLSVKYRGELRQIIDDHQIGYDTRYTVFCPECGTETIGVLEGLPSFFSPPSLTTRTK